MSRVKTLLIATILVVGILFPTTPILASPGATVSITDAALSTGASGSVVLSISATEPVSCIDIDITYDSAVVEVTSVSGSDFDGLESNIQDNHTHLVAWVASPTGLTGTIKVADITLTRLAGESELALDIITLKGDANNPIPFTVINGSVAAPTEPTPTPPTGGAPAPPAPPPGTTDVRGIVTTVGRFTRSVTATSEDGLCTLTIPSGTVGLTEELEPIDEITVVVMDEPPAPPEDAHVVGLAYDFGPDGATFDPPITLTFSYDPDALPEGVAEEDLVLAYYDEATGKWVELECVVDTENNTITASVPHFTTFAVIGRVPAPPEEEEVPTVVPPVGEEEEEPEVVIPPAPAAFSVSYLSVSPRLEVEPGETVAITVLVANTGGESGSYTVVLKIDGVKEAEETVTVAAGESQDVSFSLTRDEPGTYSVAVDGLSGSFTVVAPPEGEEEEEEVPTEPEPGFNWPLYGGIIGVAVIVAGLLIYVFVFRRREY